MDTVLAARVWAAYYPTPLTIVLPADPEAPMRPRTLLMTLGIAALAAGCSGSPTTPARQPGGPAFEGGLGMGSGNLTDSTATPKAPARIQTGATGASAQDAPAVVNGLGMGSGN
jgi:hypothetical protein